MELMGVLERRQLERQLRQREVALREAAHSLERKGAEPPKRESLVERHVSTPRRSWDCDFCGRGFHAYGPFLNHKCHRGD